MQFIEALKFRSKLFFLFVLITFGLVSVSIMGTMHLNDMKKNIDQLYFGSLIPITELHEIIQVYSNGLAYTVHKASRFEISPSQSSDEIESYLKQVNKKWHSYESHFKRYDERNYVSYAGSEIKKINRYFFRIYRASKEGKDLSKININTLEKHINYIHTVLGKLINYEMDVAHYERKSFLRNYEETKIEIGIILLIVIIAILMISFYVFRSIQNDHTELEKTTKKLRVVNRKLENVSYTDSLTTLHNRRYFNLVYDREIKRAKRSNNYITFMMLDIDFFKQYNDTYGHIEGDFALKTVAKVLKDCLNRPSDYVFRLGGEEFGVLLSDTDESSSAKIARNICDAIRQRELKHENSEVNEYVTISIGVVCCIADDALHNETVLSRADEMLYEAKESGRDRYIITSNVSEARPQILREEKLVA